MVKNKSRFGATIQYMGDQKANTGSANSFGPDKTTFVNFWT